MARILLAEDDGSLRGFLTRALERAGHQVIDCENGDEAIDALEHGPYDLLLTDIVMPGSMSGLALVERCRGLYPEMAALVTTGFADGQAPTLRTRAPVLDKPYTKGTLGRAVLEALKNR